MQEQVFAEGYTEEKLRHNTIKIFKDVFGDPNISLGLYNKKELVAFAISQLNPKENKLLTPDEFDKILAKINNEKNINYFKEKSFAIIKLIIVKKEYRGNGFQIYLLNLLEKMIKEKGIKCLIASVAPKNYYSLNNFLKSGFIIVGHKFIYNNNERFILLKII